MQLKIINQYLIVEVMFIFIFERITGYLNCFIQNLFIYKYIFFLDFSNNMTDTLTPQQKAFLEECNLEFSERFTDADPEYKEVYEKGIPPPPIMCPWYSRHKLVAQRNRNYNNRYDRPRYYNDRNNDRKRSNSHYGE